MSSVQLSFSSSGAARGSLPQPARRNVCRSLFGPVNHSELNRDMDAKLREIYERDEKRWNFNFVSGTPLQGAYEWEGAAVEATPVFYRESVRRAVTPQPHAHRQSAQRIARAPLSLRKRSCTRGTTPGKRRKTSTRFTTNTTSSRVTGGRAAAEHAVRVVGLVQCKHVSFLFCRFLHQTKEGRRRRAEAARASVSASLCSEQTPRKRLR